MTANEEICRRCNNRATPPEGLVFLCRDADSATRELWIGVGLCPFLAEHMMAGWSSDDKAR